MEERFKFDDEEFDSLNSNEEGFDDFDFGDDDFELSEEAVLSSTTEASEPIDLSDFDDSNNESLLDDFDIPDEDDDNLADGVLVDKSEVMDEEDDFTENDFISDSGAIVVQDNDKDTGNGFSLEYVDIKSIAITQRIRSTKSVEALVQSIKSTGLLEPITVAPTATEGLYVLLDGYRRIQACARVGKTMIPCIINNKVSTPEIPILEAMYNHSQKYSIKEKIDYIDFLEKQKGIMNPSMIEYLLQMNTGDYTKLKDILNDNDEDIVDKLLNGTYDIASAFRALEKRRKKETAEEKENQKASAVYEDAKESGADQIEGSGEEADGVALTDEQIKEITINAESLDDDIEDEDLGKMVEEDKNIDGFEPHKQKVGEREYIDPIIKKTVMARDENTCQCCKRGGQEYIDILDFHHILPVYLSGVDSVENGIMLCVACHRLVHLYSTNDLHISSDLIDGDFDNLSDEKKAKYENSADLFEDEKRRFKRIVKLGSVIRKGIVAKGINAKKYKEEHSNKGIGRRKPGVNAEQEIS